MSALRSCLQVVVGICVGIPVVEGCRLAMVVLRGSLWVVQWLCVVWLVLVVLSPSCRVFGGRESTEG